MGRKEETNFIRKKKEYNFVRIIIYFLIFFNSKPESSNEGHCLQFVNDKETNKEKLTKTDLSNIQPLRPKSAQEIIKPHVIEINSSLNTRPITPILPGKVFIKNRI